MKPRFPKVEVKINLSKTDGEVFNILGECRLRAKEAGLTAAQVNAFTVEAVADDFIHLLNTVDKWFSAIWTGKDPRK